MIRIDFDFESKLKQLEVSQLALKENLNKDLDRLKDIVGKPLHSPAIPKDLIKWAEKLFAKCVDSRDFKDLEDECPRILKYLTVSSNLSQYLNDSNSRDILFKLLEAHPGERTLSNLLLHFFTNFLTIEDKVIATIKSLLLTFLKENTPRLALTQFYIKNKLSVSSHRSSFINKVLGNIPLNKLLSGALPAEVRGTDFYYELLIASSGRLHNNSFSEKDLFWNEIDNLEITELHKLCLAKYTVKATDVDKDFCVARALKRVGDPVEYQLWRISDKYSNRSQDIEHARKKIEMWINEQFIAAFFQSMEATSRGAFWQKHIKDMISVKVLAPLSFLHNMKISFPSAKAYLDDSNRFMRCGGNVAGVLIEFKQHVILVFSIEGMATICRFSTDPKVAKFKYYGSLRSLVDGSLQLAFTRNGNNISMKNYGRMIYFPDWEPFFDHYLKNKII